jgi:hypothetical protein
MLKSIKTVTYQVVDLERAKQWYRQILGQDPAHDFTGFRPVREP